MITIPLAVLMVIIAGLLIKFGKQKPVPMLFGLLVGVVLASTPLGPPLADGVEYVCRELVKLLEAAFAQVGRMAA